jgi:hypothetical protein
VRAAPQCLPRLNVAFCGDTRDSRSNGHHLYLSEPRECALELGLNDHPKGGCFMHVTVPALLLAVCLGLQHQGTLAAGFAFQTPSRNIGCIEGNRGLRCDIGQKEWQSPPRPSSCHLAYGDSLSMSSTGRPQWRCHGDTVRDEGRILPYGATWEVGPFTCTSRTKGLTCTNRHGHGFFLSRQSYRLF